MHILRNKKKYTQWEKVQHALENDMVAFVPTDTLYGLVCRAFSKTAVSSLYSLKERDEGKPCIILITRFTDIESFGIQISKAQKIFLEKYWPGKVSVIIPCSLKKFEYVHRGTGKIAFRMIGKKQGHLYTLINRVGPLLAPSANPQGKTPAATASEARQYFGDSVGAYVSYGKREGKASTLVEFNPDRITVLRQGDVYVKQK